MSLVRGFVMLSLASFMIVFAVFLWAVSRSPEVARMTLEVLQGGVSSVDQLSRLCGYFLTMWEVLMGGMLLFFLLVRVIKDAPYIAEDVWSLWTRRIKGRGA